MTKMTILEQYQKCAEICSKTDYRNKASVRANNRAIEKMYKIVVEAIEQGPSAINELASLLDDSLSAPWIAHQLLEKTTVSPEIERKCLSVIRNSVMEEGSRPGQQMGEEMWLKRWNDKKFSS